MKNAVRYLQSFFYIGAGLNHFRKPESYLGLIPPYFPHIQLINLLAGMLEIILGLLLLFTTTRKWGAFGIMILLVAFIPAHIYFIQMGGCIPGGLCFPAWVGWLRLLLVHPLLLYWAWWCSK